MQRARRIPDAGSAGGRREARSRLLRLSVKPSARAGSHRPGPREDDARAQQKGPKAIAASGPDVTSRSREAATQPTLILIDFGFASGFLGRNTVRIPFLESARIFSASIVPGSEKERVNTPCDISTLW